MPQIAFLFAVTGLLLAGAQPRVPRFEDYRVSDSYTGKTKPPHLGDPNQYEAADGRCLAVDPAGYSAERVNFAGHFVIETCTCGSGCHFLFLWDAITGKLFYRDLPFAAINVGPFSESHDKEPLLTYAGEEYHRDSNLLVIEGCFGETCDCAKRFYRWTGSKFKLILKQPVHLPEQCLSRK